ncbi:MAG: LptF/LptG family permease [Bacteroidota bacterium]|nr:LptF/LptG family permease [Bacteroidota bacterium]MDE2645225.1 LptF/LptG family permease [Bacteroidota bacterium]
MALTTMDRHIITRTLLAYTFLIVALVIFFILIHYLEHIDDFLDRNASMRKIYLIYYPSFIPDIILRVSPLALFLAAIFTTSRLAQSLQVIALQTSGVALQRLVIPYVIVGIFVSAVMFFAGGWVVPRTNQTVLTYDQLYIHSRAQHLYVSEIHRRNDPTSVVTVGYFDRRTETAHRVQLQRFNPDGTLLERVDGQQMVWQDSLWHFTYATIRTFGSGYEERRIVAPLDTVLQVLPRDLARTEWDIESMTIPVAADYVDALRRSGLADTGRDMVGYYSKYTYPFANLIVMLIALPLACRRRRGGQTVQIGIGLLVAFVYLAAQKLTEPFAYTEDLSPLLAVILPHAVFFVGALAALMMARK